MEKCQAARNRYRFSQNSNCHLKIQIFLSIHRMVNCFPCSNSLNSPILGTISTRYIRLNECIMFFVIPRKNNIPWKSGVLACYSNNYNMLFIVVLYTAECFLYTAHLITQSIRKMCIQGLKLNKITIFFSLRTFLLESGKFSLWIWGGEK